MTGSEAKKMTYLEYQDGGQSNLKDLASSDWRKPRQQKLNYLFLILVYFQGSYKIHKTWTFDRHACYYFGVPIWRRWLQDLILDAWSSIIQISGFVPTDIQINISSIRLKTQSLSVIVKIQRSIICLLYTVSVVVLDILSSGSFAFI